MALKIDKVGRVILPKPIRDRLGMLPACDIEIEETPSGLLLKAPPQPVDQPSLKWVVSWLIPA